MISKTGEAAKHQVLRSHKVANGPPPPPPNPSRVVLFLALPRKWSAFVVLPKCRLSRRGRRGVVGGLAWVLAQKYRVIQQRPNKKSPLIKLIHLITPIGLFGVNFVRL